MRSDRIRHKTTSQIQSEFVVRGTRRFVRRVARADMTDRHEGYRVFSQGPHDNERPTGARWSALRFRLIWPSYFRGDDPSTNQTAVGDALFVLVTICPPWVFLCLFTRALGDPITSALLFAGLILYLGVLYMLFRSS